MTRTEVGGLLAFLGGLYPSVAVTDAMIEAWTLALVGDEGAAIRRAAERHWRASKWFPTIADLVALAAEEAAAVPDADTALGEILRAVDRSSQPPSDLSPLASAVVESFGWHRIIDSENPEALRAHLKAMAQTFRHRAIEAGGVAAAGLLPASPCEPMTRRLGRPQKVAGLLRDILGTTPAPGSPA